MTELSPLSKYVLHGFNAILFANKMYNEVLFVANKGMFSLIS